MGDRANFGFKLDNDNTIYLYGHWAGYNMLAQLAAAVDKARPRWSDDAYATRIATSQLVNTDWESETGWGLYVNQIGDNEHKVPVINWKENTFTLYEEDLTTVVFSTDIDSFVAKYSQPVD
jgi:hypothetical protein